MELIPNTLLLLKNVPFILFCKMIILTKSIDHVALFFKYHALIASFADISSDNILMISWFYKKHI